jgi:hypothetical protein
VRGALHVFVLGLMYFWHVASVARCRQVCDVRACGY